MSQGLIITLTLKTTGLVVMLSLPIILTAMAIGFSVSIFQASTQIQEQTLSFVPKSTCVFLVVFTVAPGHLDKIMSHVKFLLVNVPYFLADYTFISGVVKY